MEEMPKRFDREEEKKIINFWEEKNIFKFNPESEKPFFVIDTPPPYPSGDFHIGNVLNWCYIDFIARYKRLRGFEVFFPQGWDVHGLPTEVKVEQSTGKKCSEVPRKEWIKLCEEWTEKHIKAMKQAMKNYGFSIDWSTEYRTSDPSYIKAVQLSFLKLREKGFIYRGKHPINWCPRCETAIADAEVEYITRKTKLNFIKFPLAGEGEIVIATTRPELLHACVAIAVNPEDERYKEIIGRYAIVPIFGQEVEIIPAKEVDPEYGTGVVMICTFGDKQDVEWVFKHGLPIIEAITEDGKLKNAKEFSNLSIPEAREKIIEELRKRGYLLEQKEVTQNVGICWRCKTPIEILHKEQWFVAVTKIKDKVIKETKKVKWIPEHYALRQINWAKSMTWDWVISRQKVYGTPIPVWYCKKCGNIIFAEESQLPVDPVYDSPPVEACPKCGGELIGETDTMDTWMDSSITIAYHANWPENFNEKLFPADLQPNGADIIRTWDYYLMVRHLLLFGKAPYKTVLINGLVLGEDGRKMSKSLGNFVTAKEVYEKYPVDAIRYWAAAGGAPGSDIPFSWKEVEHGNKLITKFWNISRFCSIAMKNGFPEKVEELHVIDKWILAKLQEVIKKVTQAMEDYKFNQAIITLEKFLWNELADNYIEMIKYRLYGGDKTVIYVLYKVLKDICIMLSPFMPFVTEAVYQRIFAKNEGKISVALEKWPEVSEELLDKQAYECGEIAKKIISAIRQWKSSHKLSLKEKIYKLVIECDEQTRKRIEKVEDVIKGTAHVEIIEFGKAKEIDIEGVKIDILAKQNVE